MVATRFSWVLFFFFALAFLTDASAQPFNKTFSVPSDAVELEVINQMGAIRITTGAAGKLTVNARRAAGPNKEQARIDASQPDSGKVKIEVSGRGTVEFEIVVPPAANLNLLCYKCTISVANAAGAVVARNTGGAIQLTGLRSARVEAHSADGPVNFAGDILGNGIYSLKSFSGRVDATLPVNGDFKLLASAYRGGMELGGFPLKFDKQTGQLVEGVLGSGKATVSLWTQEGSIHLHRKP